MSDTPIARSVRLVQAYGIRDASADLRKNVYSLVQTEYQEIYNEAINDAADFLIDRAIEMESK